MIRRLYTVLGDSQDPYRNLAVEQALMEAVEADTCILYLWQNQRTVVIGRNQNAWRECRLRQLEEAGGRLARRLSGGGAVFHDLGNLNFTFLVKKQDYDLSRQLNVVVEACRSLGIPAERSGRNDVLTGGQKFSGNAFYDSGEQAYHHGTLLVDVDLEALSRYLNPSKAKLSAKGVASVRSRVVNLRSLRPGLTVETLKRAMLAAFETVYGLPASPLSLAVLDAERIQSLTLRNASWEWRLGQRLPFTCACEEKFDWGELRLELEVAGGEIARAQVWSDAMDWAWALPLQTALTGCRFSPEALAVRLADTAACPRQIVQDVQGLLFQQIF